MSNANFSTELVPWKHVSNFVRRTHSRRAFSVNGQSKKVCHSESRRWSGELRRQCKQSLSQALCRIVGYVSHLKKCGFIRAKSSMPARVLNITLHASVLTPGHRAKIGVLNVSCCSTAIYPATLSRSCPEPNARSMWKRIWFCGVSNGRANNTPHCLACRWCTYNASRN